MKRTFGVALATLCFGIVPMLATAAAQEETAAQEQGPVSVNMWVLAGTESEWWHKIKDKYEAENPDVSLNLIVQQFDNLYETTYPALASQAEDVDLIWTIGGMRTDRYGQEGLVVDLAPHYEERGWSDALYPAVQQYRMPDGTFPFFSTDWIVSPVYYYNEDIFAEVGVEPPAELDDILTLGEKFKAAGYIPWAMGSKHPSRLNKIITNLFARYMTKEEVNDLLFWERDADKSVETAEIFKHPGVRQAYEFIDSMNQLEMFPRGAISMDEGAARLLFTKGEAAMHNTGTWGIGILNNEAPDLNYNHFVLPPHNGNTVMLTGFANGLTVPAWITEQKLEAVLDIMDKLTQRDYAILSYDASLLSACMCVTPEDISQVANPMMASVVEAVQKNGSVDLFDPWASPQRNKDFNHANASLIAGSMSVDEVVDFFYEAAVAVLE